MKTINMKHDARSDAVAAELLSKTDSILIPVLKRETTMNYLLAFAFFVGIYHVRTADDFDLRKLIFLYN